MRSTGTPSKVSAAPIRNSQARGALMKKALSDRPVSVSQMQSDNDNPPSTASAIGSASRAPLATRSTIQRMGGSTR